MKKQDILPILIVIAFCGISVYMLNNSHKESPLKNIKSVSANKAAFEDFNFSEYYDGGANKKFTIQGKHLGPVAGKVGVFQIAAMKVTEITDAVLTVYENGKPVCYVMSKKASLGAFPEDKTSFASMIKSIEFSGKVDVVTADKRTLVCRNVTWDKAHNRLYASGNCVLRTKDGLVRADYIDSDLKLCEFSSRNDKFKKLRALTRAVI